MRNHLHVLVHQLPLRFRVELDRYLVSILPSPPPDLARLLCLHAELLLVFPSDPSLTRHQRPILRHHPMKLLLILRPRKFPMTNDQQNLSPAPNSPARPAEMKTVQRNPRNHRSMTSQPLTRMFHHHSLAGLRLSTTQLPLPLPKNQILLPKVLLPLRLLFLVGPQLVLHNH